MKKIEFYGVHPTELISEFYNGKTCTGNRYDKLDILSYCKWNNNLNVMNNLKSRTIKCFIYLICSILMLNIGCKKTEWYDVKSNSSLAVPSTLRDMQALLDNPAALNGQSPGMGEVASDGHYVSDARGLMLSGADKNAYTWSHDQAYLNVQDWFNTNSSNGGVYRKIYYANLVLDGMYKITVSGQVEQDQFNNIKGQALFHRAHAFYELSQIFVPPFLENTADAKLGIPLRLESDVNIPSVRSTIRQTYSQIINDLNQAKNLLPESPLFKTRPSKQAVNALLARIYLSMENFEQAAIYAQACLSSYSTLMDYKSLNTTGTLNPIIGYNPEIIFYSYMLAYSPTIFSNILIDQNWYVAYSDNDLRKKVFFNRNVTTGLVTYKGTYSSRGFSQCFSGLATDEIYLIRAECYAREGKLTEAMADLNSLIKMRWDPSATIPAKPYIDIVANNREDALKKVLDERKKELILRGLRWSDLRRLNRDDRFKITLTRKIGDKNYILEPNSFRYTFPLPDDVIEQTGMEQNPGWAVN